MLGRGQGEGSGSRRLMGKVASSDFIRRGVLVSISERNTDFSWPERVHPSFRASLIGRDAQLRKMTQQLSFSEFIKNTEEINIYNLIDAVPHCDYSRADVQLALYPSRDTLHLFSHPVDDFAYSLFCGCGYI